MGSASSHNGHNMLQAENNAGPGAKWEIKNGESLVLTIRQQCGY